MLRSFTFYGFLLLSTFFFSTPLYADGFDILGIPRTANMNEARRVYRALVKEYHPDRNRSPGAEEKLKAINNAYDEVSRILSSSRTNTSSHDNTEDFSSAFTQAANNGYTHNNSSADMAAVINQLMAVLRREFQKLPTKPLSTMQNVFFNSSSAGDINAFVAFLRQNQINPQNYSEADLLKLLPFYENEYLLFFQLALETFWMKYSGAKDCFHPTCRHIYSTFLYSKSIGSALGRSVVLQMGKLNSLIMGLENDHRPMNRREKIALDKQLLKTYFLNTLRACDEKLGADCLIDFLGEVSWASGTFANVLEKKTAEKLSEATARALASPQAAYNPKGKMKRIAQNLSDPPYANISFGSSRIMGMCSWMLNLKK